MKKTWIIVMAGLLVAAMALPAFAWEFEMKGEYENRLRYFGRTGNIDLFGLASLEDLAAFPAGLNLDGNPIAAGSDFVGFAGPTLYGTGYRAPTLADSSGGTLFITRGGFSRWGSDAFYNDSRLTLRPAIKVNAAIRVHGVYNIGGMRNKYRQTGPDQFGNGIGVAPLERYYTSQTSMNAYDGTFATWEQFRATVNMPWFTMSIGLKDFPLGTGATLGENTRAEAFLAVIPYGPFRFLPGIWLARGRLLESWQTVPDGDTKRNFFEGLFATYDSGPFSIGGAYVLSLYHRTHGAVPATPAYGPSSLPFAANVAPPVLLAAALTNTAATNAPAGVQTTIDDVFQLWMGYFKFNNGRFFANGEYTSATVDRTSPGSAAARNPLVVEAYHVFTEAGAMAGPAKLSLVWAQSSGTPLSAAGVPDGSKTFFRFPINYQAMEPYEFLMFNTYAGGNNGGWTAADVSFVQDEHGMMADAYCYAARLDYAIAANLNLFASYIWAHRLERAGTLLGQVNEVGSNAVALPPGSGPGSWGARFGSGLVGGQSPFVPDGFVGWEANLGVDWKLLEGMTFKTRYSYWQPGEWFNLAYRAMGVDNTTFAPSRDAAVSGRSAIQAFQASIFIDF